MEHITKGYKWRWWTLAVLTLSLLVIGFDATILNVAIPELSRELNASTTDLQWIIDSYLLVFAGLLLPAGYFGDRFGRKKMLLIGLFIFAVTSVIAANATSTETLIIARAFMGVGAAIIMPLTFSILPTIFASEERSKATSIWAAGSGLGLLLGPIIGGFLLKHFSWTSVFWINVPFVTIVLIGGLFLIPESKSTHAPRMDIVGMLLSSLGLASLVYGIIEIPVKGWLAWETLVPNFGGIVLLIAFVAWERFAREPLLDMKLFSNKRFSWGTVAVCTCLFAFMGMMFFLTQYVQFVLGYSAYETGIRITPLMGALVVGSLFADFMVKKFGSKWVIALGLLIMGIGLWVFSTVELSDSYSYLATCLAIIGLGTGISMAPAMDAVMEALPIDRVGIGTAVNNAFRQMSGTLGVAIMGSLVASLYKDNLSDSAAMASFPAEVTDNVKQSIGVAQAVAAKLPAEQGEVLIQAADSAFIDGMRIALEAGAGIMVLGVIATIIFLPSRAENAIKNREVPI